VQEKKETLLGEGAGKDDTLTPGAIRRRVGCALGEKNHYRRKGGKEEREAAEKEWFRWKRQVSHCR